MANLNTAIIYHRILTLEKGVTMVNYRDIFITLAPGGRNWQLICPHFFVILQPGVRFKTVFFYNELECLPLASFFYLV